MKKSTKKYQKALRELVDEMLEKEPFVFRIPKEITRTFHPDSEDWAGWDAIYRYLHKFNQAIQKTGKYKVKKYSIRDQGAIILDMIPLPMPNVHIIRKDDVLRYQGTLFVTRKGMLVSLHRIRYAEDGKEIAGFDISKKEGNLIRELQAIAGREIMRHPIEIDRTIDSEKRVFANTYRAEAPAVTELAKAVSSLPQPIIWAIIHAGIATLLPFLDDAAKPFYFPAIRLSGNPAAATPQLEALRTALAGFAFGREPGTSLPVLPEIALQDTDSIATLHKILGVPVLVRVDRDAVQRDLTEEMQRAQCLYTTDGLASYPFHTVPLLFGKALPAENVLYAIDWHTYEEVDSSAVAMLCQAFQTKFRNIERLAARFSNCMSSSALHGRKYCNIYFFTAVQFFDFQLFREPNGGPLQKKAESILSAIQKQETEQISRFSKALGMIRDVTTFEDTVAISSKSMAPEDLGFQYETNGESKIAFELNEDFPHFIRQRLGLYESDSSEFRRLLQTEGIISELSKNVRGRDGTSRSHVLLNRATLCSKGFEAPHSPDNIRFTTGERVEFSPKNHLSGRFSDC